LAALRDNTAGVNYREESGYTQVGVGLGTTDADNPPTLMLHVQDVNAGQTKAWRFMGRSRDGTSTINWGRLAPSAAATNTNIFTWSMTNAARTYTSTTITSSGIDTHKLRAEKVEVSESLTISGVPVSTGTITNAVLSLNDKTGNITITGTGGAVVTTSGQTIIIDAAGAGTGGGSQGCFTHTQSIANTTWTVAHNLGTEIVTYIVLDNADTQIDPDSFTVVDENNVTLVFAAPQAGQVHIFPCGGSSVLNLNGCYTHVQSTASTSWVVNHNLHSLPINYMVVDNSYVQVIPNSFAINSDTQATITFSAPQAGRAFIFPCVSGTGAGGGAGASTLQEAYDNGDGVIVTVSGKPVVISGVENDRGVEFKVVGSGVITEALTIGQGTTYINDHSITTGSGIFSTSLTVSGSPVLTAASTQHGSMNFTNSLTVSGQPISTGTFDLTALDARYVNVTGDSMTGNLNMQGRLVQDAGVVKVQNSTPSVTVAGLLWFDADAVGTYPSDPNLPVGGVFASTSVITSGTTVPDSTIVTIPWNVSLFDNGGWFSHADSSRLTVPSGVTHVRLSAAARFDANATGRRQVFIYRNGSTASLVPASGIGNSAGRWGEAIVQPVSAASTDTITQIETPILTVSGGDYFQVGVFHTSGGPLTVESGSAYFSALAVNTRGVPGVNSVNALKGDISVLPGAGISISSNSGSNTITVSGTTTLQTAYDNGNGVIVTTSGKPFVVSGTEDDLGLDFKVVGSGVFTEGLRVGEDTVHINPSGIKAHAGEFTNLTASGLPVLNSQSLASPIKFVRRQTLTTATGVVTFNLPQTADYLHVQIKARSSRTGSGDELDPIVLRFNNDSTAKYNSIHHGFNAGGGDSNSSDGVNLTSGFCGLAVSNDTVSAGMGSTEIWVHDYRNTTTHTVWDQLSIAAGDTSTSTINYRAGGGRYTVTSGITSISFLLGTGPDFMAGSKFVIYGYSDEEIG
jgi:hypothetical protein